MQKILFVRHGETIFNAMRKFQGISDIALNETGINQAKSIVLPNKNFDIGYHSELKRSKDTLQLILSKNDLNIPQLGLNLLQERRYGMFEGLSHDYLREHHSELYNQWLKNENVYIKDAESVESVMERMKNVLRLLDTDEKHNYIIVSHSGCMHALYKWLHKIHPNSCSGFRINNCDYYELIYEIKDDYLHYEFNMNDYNKKGSIKIN
jgi:broad specificity phosphatase PhoE